MRVTGFSRRHRLWMVALILVIAFGCAVYGYLAIVHAETASALALGYIAFIVTSVVLLNALRRL